MNFGKLRCLARSYRRVIDHKPEAAVRGLLVRDIAIERLYRMLYDMTGRTDWQQAGYDVNEYDAMVDKFEAGE